MELIDGSRKLRSMLLVYQKYQLGIVCTLNSSDKSISSKPITTHLGTIWHSMKSPHCAILILGNRFVNSLKWLYIGMEWRESGKTQKVSWLTDMHLAITFLYTLNTMRQSFLLGFRRISQFFLLSFAIVKLLAIVCLFKKFSQRKVFNTHTPYNLPAS